MAAQADAGLTLELLSVGPDADPALNAELTLSQVHALPGSTVVVSATVRNLGRGPSSNLNIDFYDRDSSCRGWCAETDRLGLRRVDRDSRRLLVAMGTLIWG